MEENRSENRSNNGWTKAYHRSGLLVTLPVVGESPAAMYAWIDDILAAGFTLLAPGLEPGEERETVAYIVHGIHEKDGHTTDYLLLYNDNDAYKFSFLKVWLNKNEDIAAFEAASSMKLMDFPQYIGGDKPERGKSKQVDKFIVPVRRPWTVILKQNPKWSQEAADAAKARNDIYSVPRRAFIRWEVSSSGPAGKSYEQPVMCAQGEQSPPPMRPGMATDVQLGRIRAMLQQNPLNDQEIAQNKQAKWLSANVELGENKQAAWLSANVELGELTIAQANNILKYLADRQGVAQKPAPAKSLAAVSKLINANRAAIQQAGTLKQLEAIGVVLKANPEALAALEVEFQDKFNRLQPLGQIPY